VSYELSGSVALVTGASRGLGYVITERLLQAGAQVAMLGHEREALSQAAARLAAGPGQAFAIPADITCEEEVRAAFQEVSRRCGRLDLLVNNAGIAGPTAPVNEITREQWDQVLAVNLTGAFLCSREAVQMMVPASRGKIINISSMAGKIGYPLRTPYAASKWALLGLTMTLAQELGPRHVQVNAICPGPVEGERMDQVIRQRARAAGASVEATRRQFEAATALRRFVRPEDVAELVLYLASPAGDNITGQAIDVSAGWGANL